MSAVAHRRDESMANEPAWLEFSDRIEVSPASVWAPDYEEETALESKPVADKELEQVTASRVDESSVRRPSRQVRILDESQALPGEASFATVRLNQQIEPAAVTRHEQATANSDEESGLNKASPRVRLLDESQVLSSEASFATVMLDEPRRTRTHSPFTEFLARTKLNGKQLTLATLLVVSVLAVTATVLSKIATSEGVFSSRPTANTPAQPVSPREPIANQQEVTTSKTLKSGGVSDQRRQLGESGLSIRVANAKASGAVESAPNRHPEAANSEESQKASSVDATKLKISRGVSSQEAKSVTANAVSSGENIRRRLPTQERQGIRKKAAISKAPALTTGVEVKSSRTETVVQRRESSSPSADASAQPNGESKSVRATGGEQRPRRVTP